MFDKKNGRDTVILERRFVPKAAVIMHEGEPGTCAYLVQSGVVRIITKNQEDGREVELARLGAGQIFGEMALVFDAPRTASVQAAEDCNLVIITRESFRHKLRKSDPTVKAILEMLTRRIIDSNNTLISKKSDIDDMLLTANTIYQNVLQALPKPQQRTFQNAVVPKLKEFLDSVRAFRDRFDEEKSE